MFKDYLEKLSQRQCLTRQEAAAALESIINGGPTATEIGGFLVGLRTKQESVQEILGFVDTMEKHMVKIDLNDKNAIDVCGTGGDSSHSFNVSTTVALVVAAGGVTVAKHGNRSVSSKSGSADVLQELGVKVDLESQKMKCCVDEIGIGFFFAPFYHPAMKMIAPHRQNLGLRTVFNMLGPLLNPAQVTRQLIGTYDYETARILANVLRLRGHEKACTVHSKDGLDEISPFAGNYVFEISQNSDKVKEYQYLFENGANQNSRSSITGSDSKTNAKITRQILAGEPGSARDTTVLNAAFAFYIAGKANTIPDGIQLAEEVIDCGSAARKLREFVEITHSFN